MPINFKKLRKYSLIILLILYIGIIIFESSFNFNQGVLSKLFSNYEDFAQPLYVLIILISLLIGLVSSAVVLAGVFIFNLPTIIILTSIGIILGIPLIFVLSKIIGHNAFDKYLNLNENKEKKLRQIFKNDSTALVILFNFVFFLPSNLGCIVGGLRGFKMIRSIIISIIGNLINQISFIFLMFGILYNNLNYLILSLLAIMLNTGIVLIIYRKNIRNVLMITFKKEKSITQ
jgi:uncharacterized membrane protein YdjX (TVP38/TMEM64 family)